MTEIISEIKFAIEGDGAIAATEELLAMDAKSIFENSKYKPKKP